MKKMIALLLAVVLAVVLMACGKVSVHCDGCGKELKVDSKMNEDWIVFCKDCEPDIDFD